MSVALINMPFGSLERPSLGISLLKANLNQHNIGCDNFYFNLDFYKIIGDELYRTFTTEIDNPEIVISNKHLTGEWLFSNYFYQTGETEQQQYLDFLIKSYPENKRQKLIEVLKYISRHIPEFVEHCLNNVDWSRFKIVGFTTMFEQTYASLILAREIKKRHPQILIGFGGANCEYTLGAGLINMFPFIDFVSTGEADISFLKLVKLILSGGNTWYHTKGFVLRNGKIINNGPPEEVDLEKLPTPDFDDYFEKIKALEKFDLRTSNVLIESSRGCWWGEKHQCTFCSLNGNNLKFRRKSTQKTIAELETLTKNYKVKYAEFTDNIRDFKSKDELLDSLIEKGSPYYLFMEVKSNLSRQEVRKLMKARVYAFQAGIESLSDNTLKIMNKGVNGLTNLALLKYCKLYNIKLCWNFIYGFPGEIIEEFKWFEKVFEDIVHLAPPISVSPIRLDKFSQNFIHAEKKGLTNLQPFEAYYHIFRENKEDVEDVALYYDFDYEDKRDPETYSTTLRETWEKWLDCKEPGNLFVDYVSDNKLAIIDTRFTKKNSQHILDFEQAMIYAYCDSPKSYNSIRKEFSDNCGIHEEKIIKFLDEMIIKDHMIFRNKKYLSLALISDKILFHLKPQNYEFKS